MQCHAMSRNFTQFHAGPPPPLSIGDDCVGFNLPWTASSGCVIYTNPMGVVRAVNPPNGSFTNRPCWKKVGGDVSD